MDGSKTVALSLKAEQSIAGMVGLDAFPLLVIRCKSYQTDVYIHTGSLPFDLDAGGKYSVRLRLDDGQPFTEYWGESTSYDSLFAPSPGLFARRLEASERLAFEFTPLGSGPVATWFDLEGLHGLLGKVADACGWSVSAGASKVTEVRKVFLDGDKGEVRRWRKNLESHTCLRVAETLEDADAVLYFSDAIHYTLKSKDGEVLWSREIGFREYKPLNDAVGCPQ